MHQRMSCPVFHGIGLYFPTRLNLFVYECRNDIFITIVYSAHLRRLPQIYGMVRHSSSNCMVQHSSSRSMAEHSSSSSMARHSSTSSIAERCSDITTTTFFFLASLLSSRTFIALVDVIGGLTVPM